MNEERMRILQMVSEGKITPEEAEKLLHAIEGESKHITPIHTIQTGNVKGKYLYVLVEPKEGKSSEKVSVKVPLALVKAGLNISKLIPTDAQEKIQTSMHSSGIPFNFNDIDPQNLDEIIVALEEMSVDVETNESTVQVFCK